MESAEQESKTFLSKFKESIHFEPTMFNGVVLCLLLKDTIGTTQSKKWKSNQYGARRSFKKPESASKIYRSAVDRKYAPLFSLSHPGTC